MEEQSGAAWYMPEELPESLPEGWTVITNTRKNGKVDRYYKSLLTGEMLRSKAKVMQYANEHKHPHLQIQPAEHKHPNLQIQPAEQPILCWDEKHHSKSNVSQDMKEAGFSLPDGWIVETKYRKGGVSAGASYKIYFNPVTGFKCYSMKDVFRYVTGREPRRGLKRRAASSSPDSVLTEFEGSIKRQPFGLENALKRKKYENHVTAARQSQNTVRRSLFGSPRLSFNGIAELSLEDSFFQSCSTSSSECFDASALSPVRSMDIHSRGGGNILDGKVNESLEGRPYRQNKQSQEKAGVLLNSTDNFIRNLSHIPDMNIAYMTSNGAGVDSRPTAGQHNEKFAVGYPGKNEEAKVSDWQPGSSHGMQPKDSKTKPDNMLREPWEAGKIGLSFTDMKDQPQNTPCELKKTIETNSTDQLVKKPHEQTYQDAVATDKDELNEKSYRKPVKVVSETSVDMMPEVTNDSSKRVSPVLTDDNSMPRGSIRQALKTVHGKTTEPANVKISSVKNRESQIREQKGSKSNGDKEEHSVCSGGRTQSSRDRKGRQKMAIIHLPSRVSRRLAGLGAGPDAYVDINEHSLRRKKRLATEKEIPPGLNKEPHKKSMSKADEEHISQRPQSTSTLQAPVSTPSNANNKDITEEDTITAEEDPITVKEKIAAEQSVPFSTVTVEENPIAIEQAVPHSTTVKEDPIAIEHSVLPLSTDLTVEDATAASKCSIFGEAFLDPCLQFAFKTLTGDFPMFDIPVATGDLFHQQKRPVNNKCTGRGESYLSAHHDPDGYAHRETNIFSKPHTPFPGDRVLNLNFATGTITRLTPFKYEFHSDIQSERGSKRAK